MGDTEGNESGGPGGGRTGHLDKWEPSPSLADGPGDSAPCASETRGFDGARGGGAQWGGSRAQVDRSCEGPDPLEGTGGRRKGGAGGDPSPTNKPVRAGANEKQRGREAATAEITLRPTAIASLLRGGPTDSARNRRCGRGRRLAGATEMLERRRGGGEEGGQVGGRGGEAKWGRGGTCPAEGLPCPRGC